uniref:C-type lectin domain-containing protein n=1 Tax=Cyanoderma ruficeps TaxID=181631 RepID=A0A8C3QQ59_9PASS
LPISPTELGIPLSQSPGGWHSGGSPRGSLPPIKGGRRFPAAPQRCLSPPGSIPVPAESEGCRLCAVGWMLIGTKCYWVSDGMNPWNKSREDCGNRGSALLVPWDQDELEFLNESLQKPTRHFWIGLSVPLAGTGWMWENGLGRHPIVPEGPPGVTRRPGACGTLKGNGIAPQNCDTRLQWICRKESAEI